MSARFTFQEYSDFINEARDDHERYRMLMHNLPRFFHGATREFQAQALLQRPSLSGQRRWDALLAALAEHLAMIHDQPIPEWCHEKERFLDIPWVVFNRYKGMRTLALTRCPAAFLRHGALPDPEDLDARGGELPDATFMPR